MRGGLRFRVFFASFALTTALLVVTLASRGAPLGSALFTALGAGVLGGVVLSALAVKWVDEMVRPLTEAARRMHDGDLEVRARVSRQEDVGQLGAAIDQLAASLSKTMTELRTERDLVSRILNGMQEGVLLLDREGRVGMMNPALREMLFVRADAVGLPLLEVVRHAELKEILDEARRSGTQQAGELELGGLKPRRLLVRATAFREAGETGVLAVFIDMTDLRRLESLRRDFVANVSHELRTPVTAVLSAAETLEAAIANPEAAHTFLGIIVRNATRLQQLIEDLLDLSRIESRELRLRPEHLKLDAFLAVAVGMFKERADKKRLRLELDVPASVEIETDRRALEQVVTNLVDNAVKYCHEGAAVRVTARADRGHVRLVVSDSGQGIEGRHLGRIFERFYRVDAGRSREMGGTGLGLAIVKHLVEALGGTIAVESTVGTGTSFTIELPASPGSRPRISETFA